MAGEEFGSSRMRPPSPWPPWIRLPVAGGQHWGQAHSRRLCPGPELDCAAIFYFGFLKLGGRKNKQLIWKKWVAKIQTRAISIAINQLGMKRNRWLLIIIRTLMDLRYDENETRYETDWGDEGREQQQLGLVLLVRKEKIRIPVIKVRETTGSRKPSF